MKAVKGRNKDACFGRQRPFSGHVIPIAEDDPALCARPAPPGYVQRQCAHCRVLFIGRPEFAYCSECA